MEFNSKGMDLRFLVLLVICVSTARVDSQLDSNGKHEKICFHFLCKMHDILQYAFILS
jgi:hypothetical protein